MAVSVDTVRSIAAPIVSAAKLDLEDVTVDRVGRRDKVCVIVDADGGVGRALAELHGLPRQVLDRGLA